MRIYDPRIGKYLSVDPISGTFPELTPYQFASNRPIDGVDLDGLEFKKFAETILDLAYPGQGPLHTETGREVLKGAIKRADATIVQPIKQIIKNGKWDLPNDGIVTTIADFMKGKRFVEAIKKVPDFIIGAIKETAKDYCDLFEKAYSGDRQALGALGFELVMVVMPGGGEIRAIREEMRALKYSQQSVRIFEGIAKNSAGENVVRKFVTNEDDLLRMAEEAAGGSLDNLTEIKPGWYQGEINGKRVQIELELGGHPHKGEGPHVKVLEWVPGAGKKGKGKF